MTSSPALQDVPLDTNVTPLAARLATVVLDTGTSLDQAFSLVADHLLTMPRVEVVTVALTTFAPQDQTGWVHLGQRAWVTEWLAPDSRCSILPPPDAGPDAALSMPWVSPRAREVPIAMPDTDLFPAEAEQDRRELAANGIRSLIVGTCFVDGIMFGSLALGSSSVGPWPDAFVADFRLLNSTLSSRIALEQARRSLAESVAVGAQTRETQQHFFASIGHELRTPLSAIVGYTEMLVDEASETPDSPLAQSVRRDGGVILRAGEQLMAVVEDLLSAGRAVGSTDLREDVDIGAAVDDVLHWHRTAASTADVSLSSNVAPGQTVRAHPAGLRQVLANLVGNAVVHNSPRGTVVVTTEPLVGESGEPRVRVIVRDSGPGLTSEQLTHVFAPFVRYARPDVKGTGLGLSLSRSIAERDGGTIGAESTPGSGSAFWVELPVDNDGHHP